MNLRNGLKMLGAAGIVLCVILLVTPVTYSGEDDNGPYENNCGCVVAAANSWDECDVERNGRLTLSLIVGGIGVCFFYGAYLAGKTQKDTKEPSDP